MTSPISSRLRSFLEARAERRPGQRFEVTSSTHSAGETYHVVSEFSDEDGGQLLLKESASGQITIIAADNVIDPLPDMLPNAVRERVLATRPGELEIFRASEASWISEARETAPSFDPSSVNPLVHHWAKAANHRLDTDVPGTNHGRLACAWAVNEICRLALGSVIGGGLSTANMYPVLERKHRLVMDEASIAAGMVIISPTEGDSTGHVGFVGQPPADRSATPIYSNSSSRHTFWDFYTLKSWKARYGDGGLELKVAIFELDPSAFPQRTS